MRISGGNMVVSQFESGISDQQALSSWQATLEQVGFTDSGDSRVLQFLSEHAGLTKTFVWQILCGSGRPNADQAKRILQACQPLIEASKGKGTIKEI